MVLTLYKMDASPPVRSVNMVIEALKIPDIKYVYVDILATEQKKESFVKLNPQYTLPTLSDDGFVFWDSHAITTYLIAKYDNFSLYPTDVKKRALINMRLHFDSGILYPAIRDTIVTFFFYGALTVKPDLLKRIISAYDFTEKFLERSLWIAGDDLSLADICCVASISTLNEMVPINPTQYPNIISWWNRCAEFEFYKKGNQPGLEDFRKFLKEYIQLNLQAERHANSQT